MATYQLAETVNLIAGMDLRGKKSHVLQIQNSGGVGRVVLSSGPTLVDFQIPIGVLAEEPRTDISTEGHSVPVALLSGVLKMKAADTITAGDLLQVSGSNDGTVARDFSTIGTFGSGASGVGIALESAVAGDVFEVLAQPLLK